MNREGVGGGSRRSEEEEEEVPGEVSLRSIPISGVLYTKLNHHTKFEDDIFIHCENHP